METIAGDNKDSNECLRLAMIKWLKLNYNWERNGVPSWRMLAKAIRQLDGGLFNKIAQEHPGRHNKYTSMILCEELTPFELSHSSI